MKTMKLIRIQIYFELTPMSSNQTSKKKQKKVHRHSWHITENECRNCGYDIYQECWDCGAEREIPPTKKKS